MLKLFLYCLTSVLFCYFTTFLCVGGISSYHLISVSLLSHHSDLKWLHTNLLISHWNPILCTLSTTYLNLTQTLIYYTESTFMCLWPKLFIIFCQNLTLILNSCLVVWQTVSTKIILPRVHSPPLVPKSLLRHCTAALLLPAASANIILSFLNMKWNI